MRSKYIYTKICPECGKTFQTTSNRKIYCYDQHYRICKSCGKRFPVNPASTRDTCCVSCYNKIHSDPVLTRCVICGKEFYRKANELPVCDDIHIRICAYCGKEFIPSKQQLMSGTKTCSKECRYNLMQKSFKDHIRSDPEWYSEVVDRYKKSCLESYGVDNPMKSNEVQSRARSTCLRKYGESSFTKTKQFIEKTKETNRQRYGADWYQPTDEFKERSRETCLTRYGVDNPGKAAISIIDKMTDPSKVDALQEFRVSPSDYVSSHFTSKPTLRDLSLQLGIRDSSVGWILHQSNCSDIVDTSYSSMECEVVDFLSTLLDSSEIEQRTRRIIAPYELDIYLPSYHIGIECNPTWTHNSDVDPFPSNEPKSPSYHKHKTDMCEEKGIFLFHIFGSEWSHKREIIESMLSHLILKDKHLTYARKTDVKLVDTPVCKEFLNKNHRQGYVTCSVRLGLYDNVSGELLSVMTFSKPRMTIGKYDESDSCWELVRFCNKLNTSVVGGASKLLKYFIENYDPSEILSFSDRAHTKGTLYSELGFVKSRISDPGYCWVRLSDDLSYSRINAQKQNIKHFLKDNDIDLSKSEREIMVDHGFVRVFDSGTITWTWRRNV